MRLYMNKFKAQHARKRWLAAGPVSINKPNSIFDDRKNKSQLIYLLNNCF